ncbi:hypothetical protein Acife_0666 [Acidithiobacillus ferrivorans SS3]|uniref:Uncharacterized protein n=2 Tax=Acidithiobacillus ferrivorans TaxID=160808 RepID=G0JLB6_9PROT|nr:hypothetical protein Acife_0666 [Acidithiobacillus ferrivorans SS3]
MPASPDTYRQYTSVMTNIRWYHEGMFQFTMGDIGSFRLTAIDTYLLERIFKPGIMIDPGTAGSHLPQLSMGDVVIGARAVNFSNYMAKANGTIVPSQFSALAADNEGYMKGNPNPNERVLSPVFGICAAAI